MRKKLYYAETGMGATLLLAENEDSALAEALRCAGTAHGVKAVRAATDSDIAWVSAMGGRVPKIRSEA